MIKSFLSMVRDKGDNGKGGLLITFFFIIKGLMEVLDVFVKLYIYNMLLILNTVLITNGF